MITIQGKGVSKGIAKGPSISSSVLTPRLR